MAKFGGFVLRSLRMTTDLGSIRPGGFERSHKALVQFRFYSQNETGQSSTSNWGAGEPPVEDTKERGVTDEQGSSGPPAAEKATGRQSSPTSTSGWDTGAEVSGQPEKSSTGDHVASGTAEKPSTEHAGEQKKSRTGADMTDDGQVQTPNLGKMSSTREMIQGKGKQVEDRLQSEKEDAPAPDRLQAEKEAAVPANPS